MRKHSASQSGLFNPRVLVAFVLCSTGLSLAMLSFAATPLTTKANPVPDRPLASAATGSWTIVPSDNAALVNALVGVTCVSSSDCWAVGRSRSGSIWQTLIEHWDGNSWSVFPSPNTSTSDDNFLYGVACTSASQCWAVGNHSIVSNFGFAQPLIERWNGTAWTIDNSPMTSQEQQDAVLSGVTCNSASDCWATGKYILTDFFQTLVEHWDGNSWSVVTSANTNPRESNVLSGVTCVSASECWAVGNHDVGTPITGSAPQATLTEHWDGTSWSIVSSPSPTTNYDILSSVSCASLSDCTAVGLFAVGTIFQTLVEHWDGSSWLVVQSPNPNPMQDNVLETVTCNSTSDCWAVGYFNAGDVNNPMDDTLIAHWDGSSWSTASSPNRSNYEFNFLYGVTCLSAFECWAVGVSDTPNAITLVEHYRVMPAQLTTVVSRMTHGTVGTFDVDLPLTGTRGVECRSGGVNGDYTLVFTFTNTLTSVGGASISSGAGTVSSRAVDGTDAHNYIVNLTGVTNAQYVTVTLTSVTDSVGNSSSSVPGPAMGVLVGDVNASGVVTSGDTNLCKAQALQPVTSANFRNDINASGTITTGDANIIKQNALHQLPTPP